MKEKFKTDPSYYQSFRTAILQNTYNGTSIGRVAESVFPENYNDEKFEAWLNSIGVTSLDQRVLDTIVTDEVSIGDYVLTGGELPALVMMDTISRLVPGVLNNEESAEDESHSNGLLEYPQYTRPYEWNGMKVPDVLISGNHALIAKWRTEQALEVTKNNRPDMYENYVNQNKL